MRSAMHRPAPMPLEKTRTKSNPEKRYPFTRLKMFSATVEQASNNPTHVMIMLLQVVPPPVLQIRLVMDSPVGTSGRKCQGLLPAAALPPPRAYHARYTGLFASSSLSHQLHHHHP